VSYHKSEYQLVHI